MQLIDYKNYPNIQIDSLMAMCNIWYLFTL